MNYQAKIRQNESDLYSLSISGEDALHGFITTFAESNVGGNVPGYRPGVTMEITETQDSITFTPPEIDSSKMTVNVAYFVYCAPLNCGDTKNTYQSRLVGADITPEELVKENFSSTGACAHSDKKETLGRVDLYLNAFATQGFTQPVCLQVFLFDKLGGRYQLLEVYACKPGGEIKAIYTENPERLKLLGVQAIQAKKSAPSRTAAENSASDWVSSAWHAAAGAAGTVAGTAANAAGAAMAYLPTRATLTYYAGGQCFFGGTAKQDRLNSARTKGYGTVKDNSDKNEESVIAMEPL